MGRMYGKPQKSFLSSSSFANHPPPPRHRLQHLSRSAPSPPPLPPPPTTPRCPPVIVRWFQVVAGLLLCAESAFDYAFATRPAPVPLRTAAALRRSFLSSTLPAGPPPPSPLHTTLFLTRYTRYHLSTRRLGASLLLLSLLGCTQSSSLSGVRSTAPAAAITLRRCSPSPLDPRQPERRWWMSVGCLSSVTPSSHPSPRWRPRS